MTTSDEIDEDEQTVRELLPPEEDNDEQTVQEADDDAVPGLETADDDSEKTKTVYGLDWLNHLWIHKNL